ncbi:MAG: energy-coupling factor transporter transmembrane protein EcfT [Clostridiales bacterium]|nr:energy-coupling factor transporter transmembrane protein EcfT [Clostridiales bacterium]
MSLYLYQDRNTFFHRLDPRTKFLGLIVLFAGLLSFNTWLPEVFILGVLALFITGAGAWPTVARLKFILFMLALMAIIIWSFMGGGTEVIFWRFTVEGLLFGIATALKLINMVLTGALFLATTRNEEMMAGLLKLGLPFAAGFAISTALRLVPTLVGSGLTIIEAQRSRGLDLSQGNFITRLRKQIPLLIPVVATAIRSTHHLAMAVEAKGFGYSPKRTQYLVLRFTWRDGLALLFFVLFLGGVLAWHRYFS